MLRFRKKILLSELILFSVFFLLFFPFGEHTIGKLVRYSWSERTKGLTESLKECSSIEEMIERLKNDEAFQLHRVTLADQHGKYLYDVKETPDEIESPHPAVERALQNGKGYAERYSHSVQEMVAFFAVSFDFKGDKYVLRTGYPLQGLKEFQWTLSLGFLTLGAFFLTLYAIMTWVMIHRLIRPIHRINEAILSYQEGREELLPRIPFSEKNSSGEFAQLILTLNSLTERVQREMEHLTQQRRETEGILESLGEGVVAFDTGGKITFVNQGACRMLGAFHPEIIGKSLIELSSKQVDLLQKGQELVLQVLQTSEAVREPWTDGKGNRIHLDLIAAPLSSHHGAVLVLQDKSADYKVLEMGKDFIANASHELRTPITIIRGFAETLNDRPDLSPEMKADILQKIVRTCGRLDKLVKSLLTLADIEHLSEDRFRPTDLVFIAEHSNYLVLMAHPGIHLTLHTDLSRATILADVDLIDLALTNLLENAVKYSSTPVQIDMTIRQGEKEIELEIKDQGIGIPPVDQPYIFDRFYTVDKARSRKSGGAGLGLSIVKTIIEKHHGRVSVTSEVGKGSTFLVTLPIKE
ncbi:MAG: PAS domain-containing protein [Verrucomicrobiota bacterium]|nr:PAS domain-containing protein [Verrucomicrobiota bacterium]